MWKSFKKCKPLKDGDYLVTVSGFGQNKEQEKETRHIWVMSWTNDLKDVDDFNFPDGGCGWYEYDSEWGYCSYGDDYVIAWKELPEKYMGD